MKKLVFTIWLVLLVFKGNCQKFSGAFEQMIANRGTNISQFTTRSDTFSTANFEIVSSPVVYPTYIYPYFHRFKEVYRHHNWNPTIDYIIKNKGDKEWYTYLFDINTRFYIWGSDSLVLESVIEDHTSNYKHHEGEVSTTKHMSNLSGWYPYSPTIYKLVSKYNYAFPEYAGVYIRRVGAREVHIDDQHQLELNGNIIKLKATLLDIDSQTQDSVIEELKQIKKNYLNTVIIHDKIPDALLEVTDRIGLMVINELDNSTFTDFKDFLRYYFKVYTSPSLVGWQAPENFEYYNDLKSIDPARPVSTMYKTYISIGNWAEVSNAQKLSLKRINTPYTIDVNPENGNVVCNQVRKFYKDTPLSLKVEILSSDTSVFKENIKLKDNGTLQYRISNADLMKGSNIQCILSVVADEDKYLYKKEDILYSKSFYIDKGIITRIYEDQ